MDYKELTNIYRGVSSRGGSAGGKDDFAKFVEGRFYAMSYVKQSIREVWQGTEDLYYCNDWEWIVKGEGFDRPVRFPTLRDFTKSLVDVFQQNPPDIYLKPIGESSNESENLIIGKQAYLDERRKSIHEKKVRRQIFEDMYFFGKGIRGIGFFRVDKNGKTTFNDTATYRMDPRHVFFDDAASVLHDPLGRVGARDMIFRDIMPYSRFLQYAKSNPKFKNIQNVKPENYFSTYGLDYLITNSKEVIEKTPVWVVKLYEYMNQEQNLYGITCNGVTIYESTLTEAKGTCRLPCADYNFEPRNDSIWGNTLAQLIAPHIYLKDTIFNLELKNLQLSLQPVVAVSGDFGYNPAVHFLQPGGIWEAGGQMNGKIGDNIQPLITGNSNTKSYEMLQNINSELSITARADLRNLEFQEGKTATEVLQQNKSMNAHNEQIESIAEIESEAVCFEIFLEVMEAFQEEKDESGKERFVEIQDYAIQKKEGVPSFLKKAGHKDTFAFSQMMIDQECKVEVQDKRSQLAQNIEKMGRIMQAIPLLANISQLDPEALKKIDFVGLMSQLIEAVGLDPERSFKDIGDVYDDFKMTKEEILFGHKEDIPEGEEREESMVRFKYFTQFEKEHGSDLDRKAREALAYHLAKTVENIVKDHLKEKRAKLAEAQQPAQPPMGPAGQPAEEQGAMPPAPQGGQIPQPDPGLMNLTGQANQMTP